MIFTEVVEEFKKAGMLRRVLTRIWNKDGVAEEYYWNTEMKKLCSPSDIIRQISRTKS